MKPEIAKPRKIFVLIFGMVFIALLISLCVYGIAVDKEANSKADEQKVIHKPRQTVQQSSGNVPAQQSDSNKDSSQAAGTTIELTDNYSFTIPDSFKKQDFKHYEGYKNETGYFDEDTGNTIHSFIIVDEPNCFPDLVEEICEGTKLSYSEFFDTAMATSIYTDTDRDGNQLYCKTFLWPDGPSTLCCIDIASYNKDHKTLDNIVKSFIQYNGQTEIQLLTGDNPYYFEEYDPSTDPEFRNAIEDYYNRYDEDYAYDGVIRGPLD